MNINKEYRRVRREWKRLERQERSLPPTRSESEALIAELCKEIDKADNDYAKH